MRPRNVFLAAALAIICASVCRAETTIKAEADKAEITTDELLTYKLIIASAEKTLPAPKLPSFDGFAVVSQAQSSTVSYRKGGAQTILVFAFILLPKQAGVIAIEPAQIAVKGKTYASEALQITVQQGVARPRPRPRRGRPEQRIPSEADPFPENLSSSHPRYNL